MRLRSIDDIRNWCIFSWDFLNKKKVKFILPFFCFYLILLAQIVALLNVLCLPCRTSLIEVSYL